MRSPAGMILAASGFGLTAQLLFYGRPLGINAVIAAALLLAIAWSLRERGIARVDAWIPGAALVFAALLTIRTDGALVAFDAVAALGLTLASVAAMSGARLTSAALERAALEAAAIAAAVIYRAAPLLARARRERPSLGAGYRTAGGYVMGAALAVPFLAVFAVLFASADAVFARWSEELFDPWTALREAPGRLVLAAIAGWIAAGAFTLLARRPDAATPTIEHRVMRAETATVLLLAIDLLFALFVGLQIAYLFGGRDTLDAAGISYSAYARRGFFELVGVAVLVAGLLFTVHLIAVRTRVTIAAALALVAFTAVVLASAAYRLDLYQRAYGWSELRLYAIAAIVFVGIALGVIGGAIVVQRMRHALQPIVMAGLAIAVGVNLTAPSAFVARANVSRALDPSFLPDDAERTLDILYLYRLGDAALPVLVEALPSLPDRERTCLDALLRWRVGSWSDVDPADWRSWSYDRARAAEALRSFAATLPASGRDDHLDDARQRTRLMNALRGCPG